MNPKLFLTLAVLLLPLSLFAEIDLEVAWQKNFFPVLPKYVSFSPDGQYLYVATDKDIYKYSTQNGDSLSKFDKGEFDVYVYGIYDMDMSGIGHYIVNDNGNGTMSIWNVGQEKLVKFLDFRNKPICNGSCCTTISPDDKYLVIGLLRPNDSNIVVYDIENDKEIKRISCEGTPHMVKLSHNGKYLAVATTIRYPLPENYSAKLLLWDTETWKKIADLDGYEGDSEYQHLKFSPDDKYLGTLSYHDYVGRIFDLSTKQLFKTSEEGLDCFNIEFLPDNEHYLMVYYGESGLYLYDYNKLISINHFRTSILESCRIKGDDYIFTKRGDDVNFLKIVESTGNTTKEPENKSGIKIISEKGKVTLELSGIINPNVNVLITDLLGKIVYTEHFPVSMEHALYDLKADLPSGIYLCRVISGNKEFTQKFEVAR